MQAACEVPDSGVFPGGVGKGVGRGLQLLLLKCATGGGEMKCAATGCGGGALTPPSVLSTPIMHVFAHPFTLFSP